MTLVSSTGCRKRCTLAAHTDDDPTALKPGTAHDFRLVTMLSILISAYLNPQLGPTGRRRSPVRGWRPAGRRRHRCPTHLTVVMAAPTIIWILESRTGWSIKKFIRSRCVVCSTYIDRIMWREC